jgi:excinuclease UvrABC ATPase subunit
MTSGCPNILTPKCTAHDVKTYSARTQKAVAPYMTYGPCTLCKGVRLNQAAPNCKINGRNIAQLAALEVDELIEVVRAIQDPVAAPIVANLASELHKRGSVYVMDERTTGLHMSDIGHLLAIINRLVDGGNTVIVIEHNLDVIRNSDWIIDMGPEGGNKGGRVMFEGTPRQLLGVKQSLTSQYLQD